MKIFVLLIVISNLLFNICIEFFFPFLLYRSSVLPFLSDEDPVCLDLLTNLTLFAFLTPLVYIMFFV